MGQPLSKQLYNKQLNNLDRWSLREIVKPRPTVLTSWNTLRSFTLFITVKALAKLYLGHLNKFETEF